MKKGCSFSAGLSWHSPYLILCRSLRVSFAPGLVLLPSILGIGLHCLLPFLSSLLWFYGLQGGIFLWASLLDSLPFTGGLVPTKIKNKWEVYRLLAACTKHFGFTAFARLSHWFLLISPLYAPSARSGLTSVNHRCTWGLGFFYYQQFFS